MTVLIGLLGGKGSGKDTAARYLCEKLGGKQYAIADELKHLVKRIYGFTDTQMWGTQAEKEAGEPSPRKGMEDVGTALREVYGPTFQVERLLNQIAQDAPDVTIISDVRYASEAQSIRQRGAILVRLQYAPGLRRWPSTHQSEQEYQSVPVDLEITPGAGGISELYAALDRACEMLGLAGKKANINWEGLAKFVGSTPDAVKNLELPPSVNRLHLALPERCWCEQETDRHALVRSA